MSLYEGVIPNFSPENIVLWLRHSILILLFIYLHDPIQTCLQLNWTRLVKYCRCINKYSFLGFECWYVFYHYSAQFMMKIRSRLTHCIKRLWDKKKKRKSYEGELNEVFTPAWRSKTVPIHSNRKDQTEWADTSASTACALSVKQTTSKTRKWQEDVITE